MKLFVLMNHTLTRTQKEEISRTFDSPDIVLPPDRIAEVWSSIDPVRDSASQISIALEWLENNGLEGDVVLVQGEYGATFFIVSYCFVRGLIPIYATSRRVYEETVRDDGSVERSHIFRHVRFQRYRLYGKTDIG
jgi:hypothetical protein